MTHGLARWREQVAKDMPYQDWVARELDTLHRSLGERRHNEQDDGMEKEGAIKVCVSRCLTTAGAGGC